MSPAENMYPAHIKYYATTRFMDLLVHDGKSLAEILVHSRKRINESSLEESCKSLLIFSIERHINHLAKLCEGNLMFRSLCGLTEAPLSQNSPDKPGTEYGFIILGLKLVDLLLDACRDPNDESNLLGASNPPSDINIQQYGAADRTEPQKTLYDAGRVRNYLNGVSKPLRMISSLPNKQGLDSPVEVVESSQSKESMGLDPILKQLSVRVEEEKSIKSRHKAFSAYVSLAQQLRLWLMVCIIFRLYTLYWLMVWGDSDGPEHGSKEVSRDST